MATSQRQFDVFHAGGHDQLRGRVAEAEADLAPHLSRMAGGIDPVDEHPTGGGGGEVVEEPGEGGFARTVGSDDAHPRLRESKRGGFQNDRATVGYGDHRVLEFDDRQVSLASTELGKRGAPQRR